MTVEEKMKYTMIDTIMDAKICVVGLGGVGGYIGGVLARKYPHVVFFAAELKSRSL